MSPDRGWSSDVKGPREGGAPEGLMTVGGFPRAEGGTVALPAEGRPERARTRARSEGNNAKHEGEKGWS
jgi:hypothetical protein